MPELWWSPSREVIFERGSKHDQFVPAMGRGFAGRVPESGLPEDAVRLDRDRGTAYIRVGELISTKDRSDTYRLANGPQAMFLEPVDTGQPHVIELNENGWTMKHPVTCRARLFHCPVHKAAVDSEPLGNQLGRFVCTVDDEGFLVIGEEVS